MLRFIFLCMGVVALSAISIGLQSMTNGISAERVKIAERNVEESSEEPAVAAVDAEEIDASFLNDIETAAGDVDTGRDNFGTYFTNTAPNALSIHEETDTSF